MTGTESVRYERRGSQNESRYAVYHRVSGRDLGFVRRQDDGTWFACRPTGPAADMVHSGGHPTRADAARELCA